MSGRRSTRRPLSEEEARLWRAVAADIEPLAHRPRAEGEPPAGPAGAAPPGEALPPPAPPRIARRGTAAKPPRPPEASPAPRPEPAKSPPSAGLDSRKVKRLAKGRIEIEARLDLHGLRQHEAHVALRRFLHAAHAQGLRHVKVITGKGAAAPAEPGAAFDLYDERQRGVLRRLVPVWLDEPDLRAIVVGFAAAGRGHGGGGALYVHLRRPARPGARD